MSWGCNLMDGSDVGIVWSTDDTTHWLATRGSDLGQTPNPGLFIVCPSTVSSWFRLPSAPTSMARRGLAARWSCTFRTRSSKQYDQP